MCNGWVNRAAAVPAASIGRRARTAQRRAGMPGATREGRSLPRYFWHGSFVDRGMKKLTPDPELAQLVRELNETEAAIDDTRATTAWPAPTVPEGNPIERLLIEMAQRGASDLILVAGTPPVFRLAGRLTRTA